MATGTLPCGTVEITPRVGEATGGGHKGEGPKGGIPGDFPVVYPAQVPVYQQTRLSTCTLQRSTPDTTLFPLFLLPLAYALLQYSARARPKFVR